jgi:hypothetical protein
MLRLFLCLVSILSSFLLFSQSKQNHEWISGALTSNIVSLKPGGFKFNRIYDSSINTMKWFGHGCSNICDSNGQIKLMSNGYNVIDKNKNFVDGLDSIGGRLFMDKNDGFSAYCQYSIFLPFEDNIYYFVNNSVSDTYWSWYINNTNTDFRFDV